MNSSLKEVYSRLNLGDMIYTNDDRAFGVVKGYNLPVELMLKVKELVRLEDGELHVKKGFKWIDLQDEFVNNNIKVILTRKGETIDVKSLY